MLSPVGSQPASKTSAPYSAKTFDEILLVAPFAMSIATFSPFRKFFGKIDAIFFAYSLRANAPVSILRGANVFGA